jgi:hypothetical protein
MTGKQAYESVYLSHFWGNKANAGTSYKRAYNKTKKQKEGS